MQFTKASLNGVVFIDPVVFEDGRGFFMDTWQERQFRDAGIEARFVQHSISRSSRGAIRGLHYQVREPQGKLVRVSRGEVFDVAVDLRQSSPDFGHWVGETLSADNRRQVWIPPGFAHGFLVLSDFADLEYRLTDFYAPEHERTIRWDDPELAIEWPLPEGQAPVLSDKDLAGVAFRDADCYA